MDDITRPKTEPNASSTPSVPSSNPSPAPAPESAPAPAPTPVPVSHEAGTQDTSGISPVSTSASDHPVESATSQLSTATGVSLTDVPHEDPVPNSSASVAPAPPAQPAKKSKGAAIFVAVILALALVGGAGYAYWANQKDTKKPEAAAPATTKTEKTTPATTEDVDKTASEIDDSLKQVDDTTENQPADLSDTSLGIQ